MDWGGAYEDEIKDTRELLRTQRAEGSRKLARVPGTCQSFAIADLDDSDIESIAVFEAEVATNRAIRQYVSKC